MVSMMFSQLLATFIGRPKTVAFDLSLKDLKLIENMLEASNFKELLQVKSALASSPTSDKPLLSVSYDSLPSNPDASAEISLRMRPLILVVNMVVANKLTSFF